jgi:hypothetical protein
MVRLHSNPMGKRLVITVAAFLLIVVAVALFLRGRSRWNPSSGSSRWPTNLIGKGELPPLDNTVIATQIRVVPGESEELPYGLEVVMQTRSSIQPVAFVIETDRDIGSGHAVQFSGGEYLLYRKTKQGVPPDHPNWFAFEWDTPAFTPHAPIIISLSSKTPIALAGLYRVGYEWP